MSAALSSVPLLYYLVLSAILFSIGVAGVLIRRNVIIVFMCIVAVAHWRYARQRGRAAEVGDDRGRSPHAAHL